MTETRNGFEKLISEQLGSLEGYRTALSRGPSKTQDVHGMRVSTRRLREAIAFLREATETPGAARLSRELRRITRALGECRALDVSAALLRREFPKARRAAARFCAARIDAMRAEREKGLLRALSAFKPSEIARDVQRLLRDVNEDFYHRWVEASLKVVDRRRRKLDRRLVITAEMPPEKIHRLRIGIKKLRYDLEILDLVGTAPQAAKLERLKRYQKLIGRWHDVETLARHLKRVRAGLKLAERRKWSAAAADLERDARAREARERLKVLRQLKGLKSVLRSVR